MRYVKWAFWATLVLTLGLFLHYTLPQRDIVRVVGTYQERQDLNDWTRIFWSSPDDQSNTLVNRDVQFIQAVRPDGVTIVYRNEDTGWGWPPYFKFDTANLQTEAEDLRSTSEVPKWAVVTHYGWRNELISIFPNAVAIRSIDNPDVTIIPWFNIFFFAFLLFLVVLIRRMWLQFRERMVDPALEDVGETFDAAGERVDAARKEARGFFGRIGAWINTWRAK